jgi:hypothetical protein
MSKTELVTEHRIFGFFRFGPGFFGFGLRFRFFMPGQELHRIATTWTTQLLKNRFNVLR